jgi:hypothetical protein
MSHPLCETPRMKDIMLSETAANPPECPRLPSIIDRGQKCLADMFAQ